MSNQTTKGWPRLAVCVAACFLIMSTLAQFSFPQPVPQPDVHVSNVTTVNVEMPPKFSLWEGVDVAIKNLVENGMKLSVKGVIRELEAMQRRHEVKLPYQYLMTITHSVRYVRGKRESKSGGTRRLPPDQQKVKKEFESQIARRLAVMFSANPDVIASLLQESQEPDPLEEPQPRQFKTKNDFVDAYVSWKVKNADEDIRAKYAKRMNGMNAYRFEMRREAEGMWKLAQKK